MPINSYILPASDRREAKHSMQLKMTWYKSGFLGAGLALGATWLFSLLCQPRSRICDHLAAAFYILNAPMELVADPLLHKLAYILGQRQLGPDAIAAPPGVAMTLHLLGWLAFFVYWFAVGVAIYSLWGLFKQ